MAVNQNIGIFQNLLNCMLVNIHNFISFGLLGLSTFLTESIGQLLSKTEW